jgi:hypothetical protein
MGIVASGKEQDPQQRAELIGALAYAQENCRRMWYG